MRIAITGGIAEGKSTVLQMLREMGLKVASSDEVARELFQDADFNAQLARIIRLDAPVEPRTLRAAMLGSDSVRRSVNRLTHPIIGERVRRLGAAFVEVPLLFEACLQGQYDEAWVVTCGPEEQRRRLLERYGAEWDIDSLLRVQLPIRARTALADRVLRTNCPVGNVRSSLRKAVRDVFG